MSLLKFQGEQIIFLSRGRVLADIISTRVFSFVYVGLVLPTVLLLVLGAAIGGAVPRNPSWTAGYNADSTGGVMFAMLENAGGFGKFVAVILAFSVIGNIACSLYSLSINFQIIIPMLVRVPRYVFSILITAIIILVSIAIAGKFLSSLGNFLGVIGYWAAVYIGILLTEYHWFRNGDPGALDAFIWDIGSRLPVGLAALSAGALSFALIIPCMNATWYTGPIAQKTGDIGPGVGMVLSVLLYIPLRTLEKRLMER
jgi:purine-cytosine permease-like protein